MKNTAARQAASAAKRLFDPKHHTWIRTVPEILPLQATQPKNSNVMVEVGLTQRGWEDVGDVQHLRSLIEQSEKRTVTSGQALLELEWEGHKITSADELYHTVWETVSETTKVHSPLSGSLALVPNEEDPDNMPVYEEEDTVLAILQTTRDDLEYAKRNTLVSERQYKDSLLTIDAGRFAESAQSS